MANYVSVVASTYDEARRLVGPAGTISTISFIRASEVDPPENGLPPKTAMYRRLMRWAFELDEPEVLPGVRRFTFRLG